MLKQIIMTLVMGIAVSITPMRLVAASCILSNAPSQEACKANCCANRTCCAMSQKNTGVSSQPFAQDSNAKQQLVALVLTLSASHLPQSFRLERIPSTSELVRAHSPPPLAATCIRLI
jgi:hypothetical protein